MINPNKITSCSSYPISIFIGGDYDKAREICRSYCDRIGLCVTVSSTSYVFTDGEERGIIVGLINYPRFPATEPADFNILERKAVDLAMELREGLDQQSFTIQTPTTSSWFSWRDGDK